MIFSVFSTVGIVLLGICSNIVSEDTDRIIPIYQHRYKQSLRCRNHQTCFRQSGKSRWKTCRFWERFLGAVEVLKLQVPKLHNSLEETQQWLTEGGVISAVKSFYFLEEHDALGGLEKVGTMLDKARYSTSSPPNASCSSKK